MTKYTLEPTAQRIAHATSAPPFLYGLGPDGARKVQDDIQAAPIAKSQVGKAWITAPAQAGGDRLVRELATSAVRRADRYLPVASGSDGRVG